MKLTARLQTSIRSGPERRTPSILFLSSLLQTHSLSFHNHVLSFCCSVPTVLHFQFQKHLEAAVVPSKIQHLLFRKIYLLFSIKLPSKILFVVVFIYGIHGAAEKDDFWGQFTNLFFFKLRILNRKFTRKKS